MFSKRYINMSIVSVFSCLRNYIYIIILFYFIGNCYAHILHNGVKHAHDDLLIDVESILCKIYSFFSNSAKRVEELKSYYDFVQVEYRVGYFSNID